jgi:hypothetical protein
MTYDPEEAVFNPEPPEAPRDLLSRAVNVALLNRATFRDVSDDVGGNVQVYGLVGAAAVASAIGSINDPGIAITNAILVVAGWLIYAHVASFMRGVLFDSIRADVSREGMMRVVGIAYGPTLLRAFAIIPVIGGVIWLLSTIWFLVVVAVGLKTTLAFDNYWPAVGIIVLGAMVNGTVSYIVFSVVLGFP